MEHGTKDIDSRLRAVRKDDDGTVKESHALWNSGKRVHQPDILGTANHSSHRFAHHSPQGRMHVLFDRIKRKLGLG